MPNQDPLGYYRALNVEPSASPQEIKLAYRFLKDSYHEHHKQLDIGTIRSAYQTLSDPNSRARYDRGRTGSASNNALAALRSNSTIVLLVVLAIGVLAAAAVFGPGLRSSMTTFSPGDTIEWAATGDEVGVVLALDERHRFPNGAISPAYELRPAGGGPSRWFPASDLERHGTLRRP